MGPRIIVLSGGMGVGKDYIADILVQESEKRGIKTLKLSLADQLKVTCAYANDLSSESVFGEKSGDTRILLQSIATSVRQEDNNVWIKHLVLWIACFKKKGYKRFIIPDCRFLNELDYFKSIGSYTIKVVAPKRNNRRVEKESNGDFLLKSMISQHTSEKELSSYDEDLFNCVINNDDNSDDNIKELVKELYGNKNLSDTMAYMYCASIMFCVIYGIIYLTI